MPCFYKKSYVIDDIYGGPLRRAGPSFGGARGLIQKPQLSRGSLLRAGPSEGGARWGTPTKKYDLAEYRVECYHAQYKATSTTLSGEVIFLVRWHKFKKNSVSSII